MSPCFPSCVEVTSLTDGPWFPIRYARLKELEVREEMLKVVADLVVLDKVHSQLRMLIYRRRFLRRYHGAHAAAQGTSPCFQVGSERQIDGVGLGMQPTLIDAPFGTSGSEITASPQSEESSLEHDSKVATPPPRSSTPELMASERYVWVLCF